MRVTAKLALCSALLLAACMDDRPATLAACGDSFCGAEGSYWKRTITPAPWAVAPERGGLRFEVRQGDMSDYDVQHAHPANRAEISNRTLLPFRSDVWFAFDLMVEPGPPITSRWVTLGQLRPTEGPGDVQVPPAWAQDLTKGDVFSIVARTSAEQPIRHSPATLTLFTDPAFQRGHAYHFVYRMRYDPGSGGLLEAWRDGAPIVDYRGPLGFVGTQGPFLKLGIYREPAPETLVAHFDSVRQGQDVCREATQLPAMGSGAPAIACS